MNLKKIKKYPNIFFLIISNLFLILAFCFSNSSEDVSAIPKNHRLLLLPVELFVPLHTNEMENYVTLYDELDNIIIKKALIHSKDMKGNHESNLRLIEINQDDLIKVINFKGKNLRAFPIIDESIKKDQDSYEFTF